MSLALDVSLSHTAYFYLLILSLFVHLLVGPYAIFFHFYSQTSFISALNLLSHTQPLAIGEVKTCPYYG